MEKHGRTPRRMKALKRRKLASLKTKAPAPIQRPPPPRDSDLASRAGHTTVCAKCEEPPLMGENVGLCTLCPRLFCAGCLARMDSAERAAAALNDMRLAGVGASDGRAQISDLCVQKCPKCLQGSDLKLPPPPPDAAAVAKKMHLLQELLGHDLSYCFRTPVSSEIYKDYGSVVPPEIRMDLGTMVKTIEEISVRTEAGRRCLLPRHRPHLEQLSKVRRV